MSRPNTKGFQKPARPKAEEAHNVRLAVITLRATESGWWAVCSCNGWGTAHIRKKVTEDSAQRHLDKKHNGKGLWV